jgi:hypothetical protein
MELLARARLRFARAAGYSVSVPNEAASAPASWLRRTPAAAFVTLVACGLVALLTRGLGTMPGLHGDEAWFGLRAVAIAAGRDLSIHGMNGYTGSLFPYLVSISFGLFGRSVTSLRAVGVAANVASLAVAAVVCAIVGERRRSALPLLVFASASMFVTSESRIAWEVAALNPLLASTLVLTCTLWLKREDGLAGTRLGVGAASLLFVSSVGVFNHLIFVAFVFGLAAATLATATRYRTPGAAQLATMLALTLVSVALLAGVKLLAFRRGWTAPEALGVVSSLLVVEMAVLSRLFSRPSVVRALRERIDRSAGQLSWIVRAYFIAGGAVFAWTHLVAFVQSLSNEALARRLYSVSMPGPLLVASYVYAAMMLLLYATALARAERAISQPTPGEYLLVLLPIGTAACLPALVMSNSIRHYILIATALLFAVASSFARLRLPMRRVIGALLASYAGVLNAFVGSILSEPAHYASVVPVRFRLGRAVETSAHFLSLRDVVARLRKDEVDIVRTSDPFFIAKPVLFYEACAPWPKKPGTAVTIDYDYGSSGGIVYSVEAPKAE